MMRIHCKICLQVSGIICAKKKKMCLLLPDGEVKNWAQCSVVKAEIR